MKKILSLLVLLLGGGCEKYHALPLDRDTVEQRLAVPSGRELQARVADLKNPLLHPVELSPNQGMTPDQAAVLAVVLNPSLQSQRDARGISQAALLLAGILPNPQLTYGYDWNTGGTALGNINAYGIGVNYDINTLISHAAKVRSAEATVKSVDLDIAWQEWQIAQAARVAVLDLISLQSQRKLAGEVDDRLADNLRLIQKAADLGLKTAVDLAAAQSASHDAHAIVLQADRDVRHQQLALNRAMGMPPQTVVKLRENQHLATRFSPPSLTELTADLDHHRLDLLALQMGYQSQEQTLVAAVLDQFPRINLGFNRAADNTNVRSVGIGVNIDIPIFNRNQGAIAAEKATRQKLYDEYIARIFDARADIAQAIADIQSINTQIADIQSALPELKKLVDVYKQAVDHGGADVLSYYGAWNNLTQKNLDLLKLQQQLADNRVALEIAAGRYFQDPTPPATTTAATLPNELPEKVPKKFPGAKP